MVRILLTHPFVLQLLKRDANRRFSVQSKTRPIGLTCSLTQDALRPWARLQHYYDRVRFASAYV